MTQKIVNDSIKLNNLLIEVTDIERKNLLSNDYHGDVTFKMKAGMIVHMIKTQGVKVE